MTYKILAVQYSVRGSVISSIQVVGIYKAGDPQIGLYEFGEIEFLPGKSIHWPNNGTAPPYRPRCGFDGLDPVCEVYGK